MTNATDIAKQIADAFGEASAAVGDGPLLITIVRDGPRSGPSHKPIYGPDVLFENINALIEEYSDYERSSSLVETSDIKIQIAADQGVVPETTDELRFAGETIKHVIKRIDPFRIGGPALSYTLHLKG